VQGGLPSTLDFVHGCGLWRLAKEDVYVSKSRFAAWTNAFPWLECPKYMILDNNYRKLLRKRYVEVIEAIAAQLSASK
jgi:hypothetical protein